MAKEVPKQLSCAIKLSKIFTRTGRSLCIIKLSEHAMEHIKNQLYKQAFKIRRRTPCTHWKQNHHALGKGTRETNISGPRKQQKPGFANSWATLRTKGYQVDFSLPTPCALGLIYPLTNKMQPANHKMVIFSWKKKRQNWSPNHDAQWAGEKC